MTFHGWEPLTVGYHAANFGSFNNCGRGDKPFLICQGISKDHLFKALCGFMGGSLVIKGSCDLMEGISSSYTPTLTSLVGIVVGDITNFNLSHDLTKPRDYMFMWLYGYKLVKVNHHPTMFCGHRHFGSGDMFLVRYVISQDHDIKCLCDFIGRRCSR